eukprot:GEMP01015981.1.p1 GENE.GEMP01015981.1~~GEMP01015981.1.p1  ORF type:complete len:527 (+),score=116.09 GEMP01015981.1:274-1854(+)
MTKSHLRQTGEPTTNGGNPMRRRLNGKTPLENGRSYEAMTTAPSPSKSSDPNRVSERMSLIFHRIKKLDSATRSHSLDFMENVLRKRRAVHPIDDASLVRRLRRRYGSLEICTDLSDMEYDIFLRNEIVMEDRARCFMHEKASPAGCSLVSSFPRPLSANDAIDYDSTITDPYSLCFADEDIHADPHQSAVTDDNKAEDSDDSYDPLIESPISTGHRASSSRAVPSHTAPSHPSSSHPVLKARAIARDDPSLIGQIIYTARVLWRPRDDTDGPERGDTVKVGFDNDEPISNSAIVTRPLATREEQPIRGPLASARHGEKQSIVGAVTEETQKRNGLCFESALKSRVKLETPFAFSLITNHGCEDDPIEIASSEEESEINELPKADAILSRIGEAEVNGNVGPSTTLDAAPGADIPLAQESNTDCATANSKHARKKTRKPKKTTYVEFLMQRNAAANAKALAKKATAKNAAALEERPIAEERAPSSASTIGITDKARRKEKRRRKKAALRRSVNGAKKGAPTLSGSI